MNTTSSFIANALQIQPCENFVLFYFLSILFEKKSILTFKKKNVCIILKVCYFATFLKEPLKDSQLL
jgi:hypothetical protein